VSDLIYPRYQVSSKKDPESFTAASMPTREQIQQAGGFQIPSSTSKTESRERCVAGTVSGPISSDIPNMEPHSKSPLSKGVITSPLDHSSVPIEPKNKLDDSDLPHPSVGNLAESGPEPTQQTNRILIHQGDGRKSETSRTKQTVSQAQECKNKIDAAYSRQMRALRTYEWVCNTYASGSIFTPPAQIKSSAVGYYEPLNGGEVSAFSSSSASETPRKSDLPKVDGKEDDPFNPTPDKCPRPPRSTLKPPLPHSLVADAALALVERRRVQQLSPCAYRSRKEADILFNALQGEVRVTEQPLRRTTEPETDMERLDRLFNTAKMEDPSHDMISHLCLPKDESSDELLFDFDETINSRLANVKGGNDGFFKDAKYFLGRR
jgi:hypothetical protein